MRRANKIVRKSKSVEQPKAAVNKRSTDTLNTIFNLLREIESEVYDNSESQSPDYRVTITSRSCSIVCDGDYGEEYYVSDIGTRKQLEEHLKSLLQEVKLQHPIVVEDIGGGYELTVDHEGIGVGCVDISFEKFDEIVKAVEQKRKQLK